MADKRDTKGADRWIAVTPSNTVNFTEVPRGIMCNVAGDVVLVGFDDVAVTMTLVAGLLYPFQPKRINSTSTTATGIVALF